MGYTGFYSEYFIFNLFTSGNSFWGANYLEFVWGEVLGLSKGQDTLDRNIFCSLCLLRTAVSDILVAVFAK